jgi:hypothetical protein
MNYIQIFLYGIAIYFLFTIFGSLLQMIVFRESDGTVQGTRVPVSMLGLALVTIVSWYWLSYSQYGLKYLTFAILFLIFACASIPRCRNEMLVVLKSELRIDIFPIATSSIMFLFCGRYLFSNFGSTVGSGNNDVAAYAQISKFLLNSGFKGTGNLVGLPAGEIARTDVTGTYSLISFVKTAINVPIHEALNLSLLFAFVLIAICAKRVLLVIGIRDWIANLIAILPQSTFMMAYLSWSFFLSQLYGTGLMLAILLMMNVQIKQRFINFRSLIQVVCVYSILTASLIMTYGHMAFVVIPFTAFVSVICGWNQKEFGSFLAPGLGGIIGLCLVFSKSQLVLQKALSFAGDSTNGWKLPFLLPSELIGFQWNESGKPTGSDFDLSVLVVLATLIAICHLMFRKELSRYVPNLVLVSLVGIGYVYFVFKDPESYLQWKWITFFLPLIVILVYAIFVNILTGNNTRYWLAPVICCALVFNLAHHDRFSIPGRYGAPVKSDQIDLVESIKSYQLKSINIKSGPYALSMWPAVYLSEIQTAILDPSYYSTLQPLVAPTLVSRDFPKLSFVHRVKVNETFDLIFPRPDQSMFSLSTVEATIEVKQLPSEFKVNTSALLNLTITNNGDVSWSGSGAFKGAINLGVRILSRNGERFSEELAHCPIVEFPNYVSAKTIVEVPCAITFSQIGNYVVEITPISEREGWFSDVVADNQLILNLEVNEV